MKVEGFCTIMKGGLALIHPDDPLLSQLFETLPDGIILFDNGIAVLSNDAARQILQKDPCGLTLIHLLSGADLELTERSNATRRTFSLLMNDRWYCLELSELPEDRSLLLFREDEDSEDDDLPKGTDSTDLSWLQLIVSSISLLSDHFEDVLQDGTGGKMQNYVAMLYKLIGNHLGRAMHHPDDHTPGDAVVFPLQTLLSFVAGQLGDTLQNAGLSLSFTISPENEASLLFGHPDHFLAMVYNVLDALIYHHRAARSGDRPSPIVVSDGMSQSHLYLRFEMPSSFCTFPTGLDALSTLTKTRLATFPPAYIASVKLVIALVRVYGGMLICNESAEHKELLLCFPRTALHLSFPVDMKDCTVTPAVEFSDTLGRASFPHIPLEPFQT